MRMRGTRTPMTKCANFGTPKRPFLVNSGISQMPRTALSSFCERTPPGFHSTIRKESKLLTCKYSRRCWLRQQETLFPLGAIFSITPGGPLLRETSHSTVFRYSNRVDLRLVSSPLPSSSPFFSPTPCSFHQNYTLTLYSFHPIIKFSSVQSLIVPSEAGWSRSNVSNPSISAARASRLV